MAQKTQQRDKRLNKETNDSTNSKKRLNKEALYEHLKILKQVEYKSARRMNIFWLIGLLGLVRLKITYYVELHIL